LGETEIITAEIKEICVYTEIYKYVPDNWQAPLVYTTTGILTKQVPYQYQATNFIFGELVETRIFLYIYTSENCPKRNSQRFSLIYPKKANPILCFCCKFYD
jgi:hypothetical protein